MGPPDTPGRFIQQRRPRAQHIPDSFPDQVLMRDTEQPHSVGQIGVPSDLGVMRAIQLHDLSEHLRMTGITLGA